MNLSNYFTKVRVAIRDYKTPIEGYHIRTDKEVYKSVYLATLYQIGNSLEHCRGNNPETEIPSSDAIKDVKQALQDLKERCDESKK